jgi:hypothetical protein
LTNRIFWRDVDLGRLQDGVGVAPVVVIFTTSFGVFAGSFIFYVLAIWG